MIRNWFKVFCNVTKSEILYFFAKIAGLSIAISSCFFIMVWLNNEYSYDKFNNNYNNTYRIISKDIVTGEKSVFTPSILSKLITESIPEIKHSCLYLKESSKPLIYNGVNLDCSVLKTDKTFFDIFSYDLAEGSLDLCFSQSNSIIISNKVANIIFNNDAPIGKTLKSTFGQEYVVSGVLCENDENSHMKFDVILPFTKYTRSESWNSRHNVTYIQLRSNNSNKNKIENEINEFEKKTMHKETYSLQPLEHAYLRSEFDESGFFNNGNRSLNLVLLLALLLILFTTTINYINITIISNVKRNVELGIRNLLGANNLRNFLQFAFEASITLFISLVISFFTIIIVIPKIQGVLSRDILFNSFDVVIGFISLIMISITLITSLYLMLFFGSKGTVKILKGSVNYNLQFRKLFLGVQIIVSFVIIAFTSNLIEQNNFLRSHNLGLDIENVIEIKLNSYYRTGVLKEKINEILGVVNVTVSTSSPTYFSNKTQILKTNTNDKSTRSLNFTINCIDENFLDVFEIDLIDGKSFTRIDESRPMRTNEFLINEKGIKALGIKDPIGKRIYFDNASFGEIVGVVRDFNFKPLTHEINPLIMTQNTEAYFMLYVKVNSFEKDIVSVIKSKYYEVLGEDESFEYQFLSDRFNMQYENEIKMANSFKYFASICFIICMIGLFGIASFILKSQELGIAVRKVFGANRKSIIVYYIKGFINVVLVSLFIAIPSSIIITNKWLQNYAFKVEINYLKVFLFAIGFIIILTMIVIQRAVMLSKSEPCKIINKV